MTRHRQGFDSPEFLRLLELAKRQTQPEAESPREALLTGQTLLEQLMFGRAQEFEAEYAGWPERAFVPRLSGCGTRQLLSDASDGHPGQRAGKGRGMGVPEAPDHRAALRRTKPRRLAASIVRF